MEYRYRATLEPDEEGRILVRFADLPEALTDGADLAEALVEAADCLSEALASRIVDGEAIPPPTPTEASPDQHIISPSPTIALKAALYTAFRHREMTVADLAARLDMDWHQAARLIDPRRASKLTSLSAALEALNCQIRLSVYDPEEIKLSATFVGSGTLHVTPVPKRSEDTQAKVAPEADSANSRPAATPSRPPTRRVGAEAGKGLATGSVSKAETRSVSGRVLSERAARQKRR
jgi:antitoxin HicB